MKNGFYVAENGLIKAERAIIYNRLSYKSALNLSNKITHTTKDLEKIKDYVWMLLYDHQMAIEKGFFVGIKSSSVTGYTHKSAILFSNLRYILEKNGATDLKNN